VELGVYVESMNTGKNQRRKTKTRRKTGKGPGRN